MVELLTRYQSYITAAITASATTAYASSVTGIPSAPFKAILDAGTDKEEVVMVTAVTTVTKALTIVRAQCGTTGVAHADNTLVYHAEVKAYDLGKSARTFDLTYSQDIGADTYVDAFGINVTMTTQIISGYYLDFMYIGIISGTGGIASGGSLYMLWIDISAGGTNSGTFYMIRLSQQSGGMAPTAMIQFQSLNAAVPYLFVISGASPGYLVNTAGTYSTADAYIVVNTDAGIRRIALFAAVDGG